MNNLFIVVTRTDDSPTRDLSTAHCIAANYANDRSSLIHIIIIIINKIYANYATLNQ